jgi:predicted transcriptional regulator
METIVLPPDLQTRVDELASQESKSAYEVLQAALRSYQRERNREKYRQTAVLIRQVEAEASRDIWIRTPSTGRIEK